MAYQISQESMRMIYYAIFIVIVSSILIAGAFLFFNQKKEVEELENSLVVSRLLYSEDCLAKEDNFGEINMINFNEIALSRCTGIKEGFKQGVRIKLFDFNGNLEKEIELNKELTTQCLLENLGNIRKNYRCSYSKNYVFYEGKKGIMEIMIANEVQ